MRRRTFLLAGLGAGGAFILGWSLLPTRQRRVGALPMPVTDREVALNGWVKIAPDDTVTIIMAKSEMGQGIHTALAMILAEELDCDWSRVRVEHSPIDRIYNNVSAIVEGLPFRPESDGRVARSTKWMTAKLVREIGIMMTGGSSSVRDLWMPMREAGAAARAALMSAAATRWLVPIAECTVRNGVVSHGDKRLRFGELLADAPQHAAAEFSLKDPQQFTLAGTSQPRLDSAAKSRGEAKFGVDVRLPDMLFAAVVMSPSIGATVATLDDARARALPGVRQVVACAGSKWGDPPAVAVIADSWWHAKQGVEALNVVWAPGPNAALSTDTVLVQLRKAALQQGGVAYGTVGDVEAALAGSAQVIAATYEAPYLAHATMEPMNCTVRVRGDGVDVWVPTQVPGLARAAAADIAGVSASTVSVQPQLLGGGFGRRLEVDFVAQATAIAGAVPGVPVQLLWSRENDMQNDMFRPACVSRLRAGFDLTGAVTGFEAHSAGQSAFVGFGERTSAFGFRGTPDRSGGDGTWDQPYEFLALRSSHDSIELPIPAGMWRAVGHSHQGFFVESFMDEMAAAVKRDPVAFRASLLTSHPRALRVLQLAAEKSGWGTPLAPGSDGRPRARGVALHASFGTTVAEVAEVSLAADGRIRVHRIVAAVDCGFAVNPHIVTQQMESAIVYGLTAALYGEITILGGSVVQRNFQQYRMLRIDECPVIETHIVPSAESPTGVGEPGLPPVAPAVANALFALTGQRLRTLPLRPTIIASRA